MKVPVLFPTYNRKEFTRVALENLVENTDEKHVDQILVVDGSSKDGVLEVVQEIASTTTKFPVNVVSIKRRHVVEAMRKAYQLCASPWIAKIDSDTIVPEGWLEECLDVVDRHPELWALGIEPFTPFRERPKEGRGYSRAAEFVGGIGLFRRKAWDGLKPAHPPFFGWTEWQMKNSWKKGWLDPPLKVFLLDHLPFEPFFQLTREYVAKKWQRNWQPYPAAAAGRWEWKFPDWNKEKVK